MDMKSASLRLSDKNLTELAAHVAQELQIGIWIVNMTPRYHQE